MWFRDDSAVVLVHVTKTRVHPEHVTDSPYPMVDDVFRFENFMVRLVSLCCDL